jgi:hypothetical protein
MAETKLDAEDLLRRLGLAIKRINALDKIILTFNTTGDAYADAMAIKYLESQEALHVMTVDRNLWQEAHNEDCPNAIALAAAKVRIAQLDRLNEALMSHRNYDPGAGNVLNGFLDERDRWKIKAEAAEAKVRELQDKLSYSGQNSFVDLRPYPFVFRSNDAPTITRTPEEEVK